MQPLIVLVTVFLLLVLPLGWWTALRSALAIMFLLTASAHWGKRRADLIRMVPEGLPRPDLLVTITGSCEILGAAGLLISRAAPVAALGLTLLLIALFPANIRAAREGITIAGRPATALRLRAVIQIVYLTAAVGVMVGAKRCEVDGWRHSSRDRLGPDRGLHLAPEVLETRKFLKHGGGLRYAHTCEPPDR